MTGVGWSLVALPLVAFGWAYVAYPCVLWLGSRWMSRAVEQRDPGDWPSVSISLPAYNEETQIQGALDALLELDYPKDRLQILVISDASSDRTDEIVKSYADQGVQLLTVEGRLGKTAAENEGASHLVGDIVVNTDASIRLRPDSIKPLVRALEDPTVGVASGCDMSVAAVDDTNLGEGGYVGYEMWVRSLESDTGSIVGASGCFYATRLALHRPAEPPHLSRDFASALRARERGFRSVHVSDAVCLVPRSGSMSREMGRKTRTMARGLATLWYHRSLLNPFRFGSFALKLFSHKLCRWLGFLFMPLAGLGLVVLAAESRLLLAVSLLAFGGMLVGWVAFRRADKGLHPILEVLAFGAATFVAGFAAWLRLFRQKSTAVWEPTRRNQLRRPGEPDAEDR